MLTKQEMRHLITLTKFHQLQNRTLPHLLSTASRTLETDLDHDRETLLEVIEGMDQLVFDEFIKKRSRKLVDVMELGILRSGVDWLNTGKPTGQFLSCSFPSFTLAPSSSTRFLAMLYALSAAPISSIYVYTIAESKLTNQRSGHICIKRS